MFFSPLFFQQGGSTHCQYGQLSSNHPFKLLCGAAEGSPTLHCGKRQTQLRATPRINSGKLVYAAEWMGGRGKKNSISQGRGSRKKS